MNVKNIQIILFINFTKAESILQRLYSPDPRGAKPRDPVKMIKAITVMVLEGYTSVTKWVEATRKEEIYSELIGFAKDDMPGVGTYYDFFDRLVDGEYHKPCSHRVKKSSLEKGLHRRNLKKEKDAKKFEDDGRAKTVKLCEKLIKEAELPNPDDLQNKLQELLNKLVQLFLNKPSINYNQYHYISIDSVVTQKKQNYLKESFQTLPNPLFK